ncbi:MAG: thioredoxin domain-containing protein [Candidatus Nanohaloarchaea archaeon]|nr:thioredoxin domain-containing protein [Candidatus Nanohaloarchaea archaeon]
MKPWIAIGLGIAIIAAAAVIGPVRTQDVDTGDNTTDRVGGTRIGETPPLWMTTNLTAIPSGETFTIQQLERPVLVEMFAVWCPTCTRQQKEVQQLHRRYGDIVTSVSLDIDPNEDRQKVWRHMRRYNFTWRYAIASPTMTAALVREFDSTITVAPRSPMVLVCENGFRRLSRGVKTAETLKEEIEQGCL